jgi:hypothetical protein
MFFWLLVQDASYECRKLAIGVFRNVQYKSRKQYAICTPSGYVPIVFITTVHMISDASLITIRSARQYNMISNRSRHDIYMTPAILLGHSNTAINCSLQIVQQHD